MELNRLTNEDLKALKAKWPEAHVFLQDRILLREYIALTDEVSMPYTSKKRREWCQERLQGMDEVAAAFGSEPYAKRCMQLLSQYPPKDV